MIKLTIYAGSGEVNVQNGAGDEVTPLAWEDFLELPLRGRHVHVMLSQVSKYFMPDHSGEVRTGLSVTASQISIQETEQKATITTEDIETLGVQLSVNKEKEMNFGNVTCGDVDRVLHLHQVQCVMEAKTFGEQRGPPVVTALVTAPHKNVLLEEFLAQLDSKSMECFDTPEAYTKFWSKGPEGMNLRLKVKPEARFINAEPDAPSERDALSVGVWDLSFSMLAYFNNNEKKCGITANLVTAKQCIDHEQQEFSEVKKQMLLHTDYADVSPQSIQLQEGLQQRETKSGGSSVTVPQYKWGTQKLTFCVRSDPDRDGPMRVLFAPKEEDLQNQDSKSATMTITNCNPLCAWVRSIEEVLEKAMYKELGKTDISLISSVRPEDTDKGYKASLKFKLRPSLNPAIHTPQGDGTLNDLQPHTEVDAMVFTLESVWYHKMNKTFGFTMRMQQAWLQSGQKARKNKFYFGNSEAIMSPSKKAKMQVQC